MNTLPVNFHGNTLYIIDQNNEPYTPMKPIVESMGLDWRSQQAKVSANQKRYGMVKITIPVNGMVSAQEMLCIPLRKLFGWLCTISPNKVKPELKKKIIQYQNECDEVLHQHWTQSQKAQKSIEPKRTIDDNDIIDYGEPLEIGRHTLTPIITADGRMWLTHYQLNDLLGYTQKNAVKSIFGRNVDKYDPEQYAHYVFEDRYGQRKHFIIESSAWIKTAAFSKSWRMADFINTVTKYLANDIAISKDDWERLQQHAANGEEKYRAIAQKSNELIEAVSDAQIAIGMTKAITQKH